VEDESQVVVSIPEEAVASSALEVAYQDKPWETVGKAVDKSLGLDLGVRLGRWHSSLPGLGSLFPTSQSRRLRSRGGVEPVVWRLNRREVRVLESRTSQ
jgi:hypothetical protein